MEAVLVTHLLEPEQVAELAAAVGVHTTQVHGDMAPPDLRRLRGLLAPPGARLLKAVHVTGEDAIGRALDCAAADPDALVLDSRTADRLGGTGRTHDWSVSARIVAAVAPLAVRRWPSTSPGDCGRRTSRRPWRGCARRGWT